VATTGPDGSFAFTQPVPLTTVFQAQLLGSKAHSVRLIESVGMVVTARASRLRTAVGRRVQFTGDVQPLAGGHVVELQHRGIDGRWHTLVSGTVTAASKYALSYVASSPGRQDLRVRVEGEPDALSHWSQTMTLDVAAPTR
jgi:hypothetical protein